MSYLKCMVIYFVFALVVGVPDYILKSLCKDNDSAIIFRLLVNVLISAYFIYYLINIYL